MAKNAPERWRWPTVGQLRAPARWRHGRRRVARRRTSNEWNRTPKTNLKARGGGEECRELTSALLATREGSEEDGHARGARRDSLLTSVVARASPTCLDQKSVRGAGPGAL